MTLRRFIQNKLNELTIVDDPIIVDDNLTITNTSNDEMSIEVGTEVPDDMLVLNQVYFSYLLSSDLLDSDFDHNNTYNVSIIGYLKVKVSKDIDSLDVIDIAQEKLTNKLKEINFDSSFKDVSIIDDIRKVQIIARAKYNEINKGII